MISRYARLFVGFLAGLIFRLMALTCRCVVHHDQRPALAKNCGAYVYAILHAHQLSALVANDEKKMAAMVSRSSDGDFLVPLLRLRRVVPVRGSTQKAGKPKGGTEALERLASLLQKDVPVLLAVDGPRGPRGHVHRGCYALAQQSHKPILPTAIIAEKKWILTKTWDRFQIPKPFSKVHLVIGTPIVVGSQDEVEIRQKVQEALTTLEQNFDSEEAQRVAQLPRS